MSDFAKIIRASDGEQVLFRKGEDDSEKACLFQMTEFEGITAELNLGFDSDDLMERAFEMADQAQADAVRNVVKKALGIQPQQGERHGD
jgi:hypothetical protein